MRINSQVALLGRQVYLVPYRSAHVPQYHEWLSKDASLREATSSEPLTYAEEVEMQITWGRADDRLTFILISPQDKRMLGDVNVFFRVLPSDGFGSRSAESEAKVGQPLPDNVVVGEISVMVADPSARRCGVATEAVQLVMAFCLLEVPRGLDQVSPHSLSSGSRSPRQVATPATWYTCADALQMGPRGSPGPDVFMAIIGENNEASLRLFQHRLGFHRSSKPGAVPGHLVLYWPDWSEDRSKWICCGSVPTPPRPVPMHAGTPWKAGDTLGSGMGGLAAHPRLESCGETSPCKVAQTQFGHLLERAHQTQLVPYDPSWDPKS